MRTSPDTGRSRLERSGRQPHNSFPNREIFAVGDRPLVVLAGNVPDRVRTRPREAAEPDRRADSGMDATGRPEERSRVGRQRSRRTGRPLLNRFYFVRPDGATVHYDKRHLFTYGGEHKGIHRRRPARDRGIQRLAHPAASLLRPAGSRSGRATGTTTT